MKTFELDTQCKIVIVDDGSTDGSRKSISEMYPEIILLQGDGSLWWTGAVKIGMKYAHAHKCDIIVWLNDDCLVQSKTLWNLIDFVTQNPRSIIGGVGYEATAPHKISFGGKRRQFTHYKMLSPERKDVYQCDLLSGNLVCMPATIIEDIGYPNPEKCPHYGGDALFLIRARNSGYSIFFDNREASQNISTLNTSKMNSNEWLLGEISVKELFKLLATPQSVISWQVMWHLYLEDYGLPGITIFLLQLTKTVSILLVISLLRRLPISTRVRISSLKRKILNQGI